MSGPGLRRRVLVTVSGVVCAVATLFGAGIVGTPVAEAAGGAFAADATLLAPAGPAFAIWSVIYLGLLAYIVWQWLPAQRASQRVSETGALAAATLLLNAAWLVTIQLGLLWLSLVVIVGLAAVLVVLVARLGRFPGSRADRLVTDGVFGLYLGWVAVATGANLAAVLVASGLPRTGLVATAGAIAVLAGVLAFAVWATRRLAGAIACAAALVWGLAWIAYARLAAEPRFVSVGLAAALAAVAVAGSALARLRRTN